MAHISITQVTQAGSKTGRVVQFSRFVHIEFSRGVTGIVVCNETDAYVSLVRKALRNGRNGDILEAGHVDDQTAAHLLAVGRAAMTTALPDETERTPHDPATQFTRNGGAE